MFFSYEFRQRRCFLPPSPPLHAIYLLPTMSSGHEEKQYTEDTTPVKLQATESELEKLSRGVTPGKVFRKLDVRLLPLVTLLFLLSFLYVLPPFPRSDHSLRGILFRDRTNIGMLYHHLLLGAYTHQAFRQCKDSGSRLRFAPHRVTVQPLCGHVLRKYSS